MRQVASSLFYTFGVGRPYNVPFFARAWRPSVTLRGGRFQSWPVAARARRGPVVGAVMSVLCAVRVCLREGGECQESEREGGVWLDRPPGLYIECVAGRPGRTDRPFRPCSCSLYMLSYCFVFRFSCK